MNERRFVQDEWGVQILVLRARQRHVTSESQGTSKQVTTQEYELYADLVQTVRVSCSVAPNHVHVRSSPAGDLGQKLSLCPSSTTTNSKHNFALSYLRSVTFSFIIILYLLILLQNALTLYVNYSTNSWKCPATITQRFEPVKSRKGHGSLIVDRVIMNNN